MNRTSGVSNLLFLYVVLCIVGITYVILNISYKSRAKEYTHSGYNLLGEDTIAVVESGEIVDVTVPVISEKPYYTFIVCVITAPDHTEHRRIIRDKSWAGYDWRDNKGENVTNWKYLFVVGKTESVETMERLQTEIDTHHDMVIADELDSYHNLVLKVLWLLQYTIDNYNFGFLLKTDDDSFINIKLLNNYLQGLLDGNNAKLFFGGARTGRQPVLRRGRYGVSKELWEPDKYPPYCSGSGYVLSFDTIQTILRVFKSGVQPLFYVEDAFIGTLAYHAHNIEVTNINGFYWHQKYGCKNKNAMVLHYVKGNEMVEFMEKYDHNQLYC